MAEAILAIQSFRQGGLAVQFDLAPIHVAELEEVAANRRVQVTLRQPGFRDLRRELELREESLTQELHMELVPAQP